EGEVRSRHLARAVGRRRAKHRVDGYPAAAATRATVLLGAPHQAHLRDAGGAARIADVERALDVDAHRLDRGLPRAPQMGGGGKVVNSVGAGRRKGVEHAGSVHHVEGSIVAAIKAYRLVTFGSKVVAQITPNEAARAGHD